MNIVHQSSCSFSLQQNGIVERKSQHLFEVARMHIVNSYAGS